MSSRQLEDRKEAEKNEADDDEAFERACEESLRLGKEENRRRAESLLKEFGHLEPAQDRNSEREDGEIDDSEEEFEQACKLSLACSQKEKAKQPEPTGFEAEEKEFAEACQLSMCESRKASEPVLSARLSQWGLALKTEIPGDGNCQFAALADQMFDDPSRHPEVRAAAVAWLRDNPDFSPDYSPHTITAFFDRETFGNWGAYCDELARPEVWGDHLSLLAAAEVYGLRIWICSSVAGAAGGMTSLEAKTKRVQRTVFLAHLHERHYDSLKLLA